MRRETEVLLRFAVATALALVLAGCASTEKRPLTPWFRQVYWWNNCIIAESGCGRGVYAERRDKGGDFERVGEDGAYCEVAGGGKAVLCDHTRKRPALLYKESGAVIALDCDRRSLDGDLSARAEEGGGGGAYVSATVDAKGDVYCVERYYGPVARQIVRRFDLDGHVVERREGPLTP